MVRSQNSWIHCPRQNPHADLRLFCFPYAGGGASIFHTWPQYLPSNIEVCTIQLPGRENRFRESPFTAVSALVSDLCENIVPYLEKPFALFGHSMGAIVSFEFARELRRHHMPIPLFLYVSACHAPQLNASTNMIHTLPDQEFLTEVQSMNGMPSEQGIAYKELLQLMLPTLRADFTLVETYSYGPEEPLDCPITAFIGIDDNVTSQDQMIDWKYQTTRSFDIHALLGDHFYLRHEQNALLSTIGKSSLAENAKRKESCL
jgi:medium-chain acyl-[acyl-carrier-protein] hydrolase